MGKRDVLIVLIDLRFQELGQGKKNFLDFLAKVDNKIYRNRVVPSDPTKRFKGAESRIYSPPICTHFALAPILFQHRCIQQILGSSGTAEPSPSPALANGVQQLWDTILLVGQSGGLSSTINYSAELAKEQIAKIN